MNQFLAKRKKDLNKVLVLFLALMFMGGITFVATPIQAGANVNVYRFYNGTEHFYTISQDEVDALNVAGSGDVQEVGWDRTESQTPIYRFYNGIDHFYTASQDEIDALNVAGSGYVLEGLAWEDSLRVSPVYRLYNGVDHLYTISLDEVESAISLGYTSEGVGWGSEPT